MSNANDLQMAVAKPANTSTGKDLIVEDFTRHPRVAACLDTLKTKFSSDNPLIISDVLDGDAQQYVHLVQKGGGVLGVALVGYTYILEMMGIRFLRLAGTSAGAINTALMTVIGGKQEAKSTRVLDAICKLDFFSLVDGHPVARWLIKRFITHADFTLRVKKWLIAIGVLFGMLLCGDIVLLGLQHPIPSMAFWAGVCFVLTGIVVLVTAVGVSYTASLLKRLKNAGYGINPGDYFYDWIKLQLKSNGVNTVSDLNAKAGAPITGLHIRPGTIHPEGIKDLAGDVTFITSELATQNKVQFPAMCNLFRTGNDIDLLQPAGFVRASMSIPIFFESYIINDIPCTDEEIRKAWWDTFQEKEPPSSARFVDGGILSNFPINLFYNPGVISPRVPVFGIDLDDSRPQEQRLNPASWSLGGYFGKVFNTIRNYYDKDFLLKNEVYGKGIGKINVAGYNWLNFFLQPQDKIDMFIQGAEAATAFLMKFDWNDYKESRGNMQLEINQRQSPAQKTPTESPIKPNPTATPMQPAPLASPIQPTPTTPIQPTPSTSATTNRKT